MFRNVALKNISISLQNIYRFLSKLIVLNAIQKGFGICVIVNLSQSFIVLCWQYQIEICHIISARRAGPKQNLALRRHKDINKSFFINIYSAQRLSVSLWCCLDKQVQPK